MNKLETYRAIIRTVLEAYHQRNVRSEARAEAIAESVLVLDETHDHYLLLVMGWDGDERIKNTMIHVRIKDEKIWIEEDWTEEGVATDLLQQGVNREEIVLAFQPPQVRQYTEFSAA